MGFYGQRTVVGTDYSSSHSSRTARSTDSIAQAECNSPNFKEKASTPEDDDVLWQEDPIHPRNWTFRAKWTAVTIVGLYSFMAPVPSAMMAPSLQHVASRYDITNQATVALTLSIFLVSFGLGPLILSPLSEMYGRTWIFHIGNILNVAFNLGCAFSPNTASLLVFRFLSGFSSSAPVAMNGGSISDLFSETDRASSMSVMMVLPLLGSAVGPVMGGYITEALGLKWMFIAVSIVSGACSVIGIPLLRETYAPVVRWNRAKQGGDLEAVARLNPTALAAQDGTKAQMIWQNLSWPIVLITRSYICFTLSLFQALRRPLTAITASTVTMNSKIMGAYEVTGIYYLMSATFPKYFQDTYSFGPGPGGLAYLGLGFGFLAATFAGARYLDRIYVTLTIRNGGKGLPEMRMPAVMLASVVCPIGLLWYGWSAQAQLHYMMPIIGTAIYGFGVMAAHIPIQLYLVDRFTYAASATGASSVFRAALGFIFPLFGQQMSDLAGYGGASTLLAGLTITVGVPFPIYIYLKGPDIRARSKYTQ